MFFKLLFAERLDWAVSWTTGAGCCNLIKVRFLFHFLVLLLALAFVGCAALIEAPLENKLSSLASVPLLQRDREALLDWMATNSTLAFSHAKGVTIIQEPGTIDRYLVQIEGTQRDLAGGLAAAVTLDGYYVTASHVLKNNGPVLLLSSAPEGLVQERARVVWRSLREGDLALIKGPPRRTCFPITRNAPRIGEVVLAGGATGGDSAGTVLTVEGRRLMHTAPLRRGDSGGPLVNTAGELVGVNRAIHYDVIRGRRNEAVRISLDELLAVIRRDRAARAGRESQ